LENIMKRLIAVALCLAGLALVAGCVHQPDLDLIAKQPTGQARD
jgi:hypothetical protein